MVGFGGQIGNSISSMLIAPMIAALGGGLIAYRTSGTFFAGIGGLLILLSFFLITEVRGSIAAQRNAAKFDETVEVPPIPVKKEKKKLTLKEMLREASYLVRNEYWVISMIGELFGGMALGFLLGTAVYFCNHVLGNPVAITGIFGTMTIGMLIGLAVTAPLIAFMDGKWICVLGNFIAGCGLVVACVGVFIFNNLPLMYAGITIRQFGYRYVHGHQQRHGRPVRGLRRMEVRFPAGRTFLQRPVRGGQGHHVPGHCYHGPHPLPGRV